MLARWLWPGLVTSLACSCQSPPPQAEVARSTPTAAAAASAGASPERKPNRPAEPSVPLSGSPRFIVASHEDSAIALRELTIVDEAGERGTQSLWPDRYACPKQAATEQSVPARGSLALPAPTHSFSDGECTPTTPLPPGRYVVRVSSGYDSIYAAAVIALPLSAVVQLELRDHHAEAGECDTVKAQRAARLGFAAVKQQPGLPSNFLQGCDVARASCGGLPLPEGPPPAACTVTLHDDLLVVSRPAGDDELHGFRAWTDAPVSFVRRPEVSRSSASQVTIEGQAVVVEGTDQRHLHTHGGDAARIGSMRLRAYNPLARALAYSVQAVEWLTSHDCGLPGAVAGRPKLRGVTRGALPSGQSDIDVSFATQPAYQAYCDRFASRVVLRVEGKSMAITVEHQVTRVNPLRR